MSATAAPVNNPKLSPFIRGFFSVASLIVLAGAGLYFALDPIVDRWLWPLTPFNANFLGAIYLAELVSASLLIWYNRWAPARVALPMSYVFTGVVTIVSFFYLDRFDWGRFASYFWFFIYIGSAVVAAAAHYVYRRFPIPDPVILPTAVRMYLYAYGALLTIYGLGLLISPSVTADFWPWPIDDFHGRVYSALFLSVAAGALVIGHSAALLEIRLFGLAQASGLLPVLGLILVDASANRVEWSAFGTWLWIAGFAVIAITGIYLLATSLISSRRLVPNVAPSTISD